MTEIQGIPFGQNEIIISVGFFLGSDFGTLRRLNPTYVENYEPLPKAFMRHVNATSNMPTVKNIQMAVGGKHEYRFLQIGSTKSFLSDKRSSELVRVISMESILNRVFKQYGRIDKLLLNCEGSEIPIINETPLKLFGHCDKIFTQFHNFIPSANITEESVAMCLMKLGWAFNYSPVSSRKYSKYLFERRT